MKKPVCADFCISEEEYAAYERQEARFSARERRNVRFFHVVIWLAAAVFYAAGALIIALYDGDDASGYIGGAIFFVGATICLIIAVLNLKGKISDPVMARKPIYYDRALAKKCEPYAAAKKEYADYVRGVNVAYWEGFSAEDFREHIVKLLKRKGYEPDTSHGPDRGSPFSYPGFTTHAYTLLTLDGANVLVQCVESLDKETAEDVGNFMDAAAKYSVPIRRVIYISVRGYAFAKDGSVAKSIIRRAAKKYIAAELWDMDDVLGLAYECGVLNFS